MVLRRRIDLSERRREVGLENDLGSDLLVE